jgi:hypothetical protein
MHATKLRNTAPSAPAPTNRVAACGTIRGAGAFSKRNPKPTGTHAMTIGTILLILLIVLVIGTIPNWQYSRGWGYYPSGIAGVVLIVVLILLLMGRI